jgi:cytoskeleton protein RodZ
VHDGIGSTLRDARNRRKIDLSEVEAATKIRPRYLRAMENDEWDALPGGPYTRSFIRTYASYLGLDGERLVDEYVRGAPGEEERPPRPEPARPPRRPLRLPSGRGAAIVVSLALVAVLVAVGLAGEGGGGGGGSLAPRRGVGKAREGSRKDRLGEVAARPGVAVELAATAEVWVCLLDAAGKPLIDGRILEAGAEEGPFRSRRFTVSLGNGEVEMRVDGRRAQIPAGSGPVGYAIGSDGGLRPLVGAERPTCT